MTTGRGLSGHPLAALPLLVLAGVRPVSAEQRGLSLVEAVRLTVARQPEIKLSERQVEASEGERQVASGDFDPRLQLALLRSRERMPLLPATGLPGETDTETNESGYQVGVAKLFRSGLVVSPRVEMSRTRSALDSPLENRGRVSLAAAQPLLRGFGAQAVAAGETAATIDLRAASVDLRHTIASSVLRTTTAYWAYVAAARRREIVAEAEGRFRAMGKDAQILLDARAIAAADIKQLRANLAQRTSARLEAEQAQVQARHELGMAMGLPNAEITSLPPPSDPMPAVREDASLPQAADLLASALERRADLRAARLRADSAGVRRGAAKNGVRPRLDVVVEAGYAGLDEGGGFGRYFTPFDRRVPGLNASASLVLDWPTANRAARGRLASSQAVADQADITAAELARRISSDVTVAASDLTLGRERVIAAGEAASLYRSAVDDEKQKLRLGLGTVIDVVVTEDHLNDSLLDELSARLAYANALVRLRFETGTLVSVDGAEQQLDLETLTTVPPLPSGSHR
ncbi:MAG TPA: TolC family protein [Vicinamibacteria bacterium]